MATRPCPARMPKDARHTNDVAQALYRKYGFTTVSTRRGYYSDNNENALVMWAGNLKSEIYVNRLRALRSIDGDVAVLERGHIRRVPSHDAAIALGTRHDDHVEVA